ncbi:MAG TPA: hypothetical protein DHV51_05180 [Opitutae bacterium]|nr:hypothetical protein [Opitutae bacterium]
MSTDVSNLVASKTPYQTGSSTSYQPSTSSTITPYQAVSKEQTLTFQQQMDKIALEKASLLDKLISDGKGIDSSSTMTDQQRAEFWSKLEQQYKELDWKYQTEQAKIQSAQQVNTSKMTRTEKEKLDSLYTTEADRQLNMQDFLTLMTKQLQYQNPMEPMSDLSFMSQMSSFTSLEQMKALSTSMASFTKTQNQASAQSYLGKEVVINATDKLYAGRTEVGIVEEVRQSNAGDTYVVVNGKQFLFKDIVTVRTPVAATTDTTTETIV